MKYNIGYIKKSPPTLIIMQQVYHHARYESVAGKGKQLKRLSSKLFFFVDRFPFY